MALPPSIAHRFWATKAVLLALLALAGCGAIPGPKPAPTPQPSPTPVVLQYWVPDPDGEIRITYRFPTPALATDIYTNSVKVEEFPEALKNLVRQDWKRWESKVRARGIRLTVIEVDPGDRTAKVDFLLGTPPKYPEDELSENWLGVFYPWARNMARGELGRGVIFIRPGIRADQLRITVPHEEGHALGLDHLPDPESLMHPTEPNSEITEADLVAVDARYLIPSPTTL